MDDFIFEDMTVLGDLVGLDDFVHSVLHHPGDKIDVLRCPAPKQRVIIISPVIDHDSVRLKFELPGYFNLGDFTLGDDGEGREITIVIQKKMQLDRPFGAAKMGPVIHRETQIDD